MLGSIAHQLEQYMDLLSRRQQVVAGNIANADTPGYRTRDIDFQTEFQRALEGQASTEPVPIDEVAGLAAKNDGNNVNLEREARLLGDNAIRFNLAANFLRGEIRQVRSAIKGGDGR